MTQLRQQIEIQIPVNIVYDQWTQFEDFPAFMEGVEVVRQIDSTHLHWVATVAGVRREWDAQIIEQVPDLVISWANTDGPAGRGTVDFDRLAPDATRVTFTLDFEPEGLADTAGEKLGLLASAARRDLERFRDLVTERGSATGSWRGEVHGGLLHRDPTGEAEGLTGL